MASKLLTTSKNLSCSYQATENCSDSESSMITPLCASGLALGLKDFSIDPRVPKNVLVHVVDQLAAHARLASSETVRSNSKKAGALGGGVAFVRLPEHESRRSGERVGFRG